MMIRSKRGDIAISLLVFMVLALSLASLFIFLTAQNKYERDMAQIGVVQSSYAYEEAFDFYLKQLVIEVFRNNPGINEAGFISKFQEAYKNNRIEEYYSPEFIEQISNSSNYEIKIEGTNLSFKLKDFKFSSQYFYDVSSKSYIFKIFSFGYDAKQEIVAVKHTKDRVFDVKI